jgi:preprotein translocase subunit SecG
VFGSRGSSNFLTKSTKWLGITFFVISMGMAVYASKTARLSNPAEAAPDLGVMGQPAPATQVPSATIPSAQVPSAQVPSAPAAAAPVAAPQYGQQPAAAQPAPAQPAPEQPAPAN